MYHSIVRSRISSIFAALGRGDLDYAAAGMASQFDHVFAGRHSLGGQRHTMKAFRPWLERLIHVLPGLHFEIKKIAVSGLPWDTTVVVEWRDFATLAGGVPYINDGTHVIGLRWGKVVSLHAYLDTQVLIDALNIMGASGVSDAVAPPIED